MRSAPAAFLKANTSQISDSIRNTFARSGYIHIKSLFLCDNAIVYMIKSMTGYGKAEALLEGGRITVEIRTLNGKNSDANIKTQLLPKDKELEVRKTLTDALQRGTVDLLLTFEAKAGAQGDILLQGPVLDQGRHSELHLQIPLLSVLLSLCLFSAPVSTFAPLRRPWKRMTTISCGRYFQRSGYEPYFLMKISVTKKFF